LLQFFGGREEKKELYHFRHRKRKKRRSGACFKVHAKKKRTNPRASRGRKEEENNTGASLHVRPGRKGGFPFMHNLGKYGERETTTALKSSRPFRHPEKKKGNLPLVPVREKEKGEILTS